MRVLDALLLRSFRGRPCEWCPSTFDVSAHHVHYRSAGRLDIRINLIGLCRECHDRHHRGRHPAEPTTAQCWQTIADREGLTVGALKRCIKAILALPKWGDWRAL